MKISLITPSYNSAATINDTLESVKNQAYPDLEYIIIDGASTDKTLDVIKNYQENLKIKLISERDRGIYDAMNKGVNLATGEIVGIINADDFYKNKDVLRKINEAFEAHPEIEAIYGDLEFVNPTDLKKIVRFWPAGEYNEKKLANGWTIPHPTLFLRHEVYKKYGSFRTDLPIAGDYEFILRLLKKGGIKTFYLTETLVCMRTGGTSGRNLKQRFKGWRELSLAWRLNNLKKPYFFIFRRVIFKVMQYFKLS